MPLPPTIRVKLSSEGAGAVSITRVVVQELATREFIEQLLGVTGKDEPRIREILLRGTLVSGASRFRWTGWKPQAEDLRELLATFPDADPSLSFAAERCVRTTLRGGRQSVEIHREATARKRFFAHTSFWDVLMEVVGGGDVTYSGYSYRDRADRYLRSISATEAEQLRAAGSMINYSRLRDQIRSIAFSQAELYAARQ
jgi:hypothetical protein